MEYDITIVGLLIEKGMPFINRGILTPETLILWL